ncbi:unnamed protein product [Ixodes pacificus]
MSRDLEKSFHSYVSDSFDASTPPRMTCLLAVDEKVSRTTANLGSLTCTTQ